MIHTRRSSGVLVTVILTCILTAISAPPVSASPEEIASATGNSMKLPYRAEAPSFNPVTESLRATNIDSFIEAQMTAGHVPGLSACIAYDGGMFWTNVYGMANFDTDTAVGYQTLFMLASISKVVTATAIMQLWEDGLFGLDDDVSAYLPFTVTNPNVPGVPITFRMLLTHSSSIRDNWGVMPYYDGDSPLPLGEYLADYLVPGGAFYSANSFYNWEPGTDWFYCNNGFALVA
ncbi:MAG: beta-lactamase family protein, partial [Phycisphaerae bacterium]|nr:beta-lactamase family protein [Phycisphaerae bacterium]